MMNEKINKAFVKCSVNGCLQSEGRSHFGIKEDIKKGVSCLVNVRSKSEFIVENKTVNPIQFLAIDGCVWDSSDAVKRCDFALFNTSDFCFVELKCRTSTSDGIKHRRSDAIGQIESTVDQFLQNNISFKGYKIEAYIVFAKGIKKPKSAGGGFQSARSRLKRKFNLKLIEDRKKTFK